MEIFNRKLNMKNIRGSITKSSTMPQVISSSSNLTTKPPTKTAITPSLTTTTIPTKEAVPDICYQITCNNATCKMLNNKVNFTKDVKNCTRNTGYCYVKETVDSAKPKIVMYTAGCVASCTDKATKKTGNITDTFSCCQKNLCNDHVHKSNSVEQLRYHFLLSLYCIVMSFLIGW
ncbi:Hypothetical predicted protein [Mytilus galloprovincialis]|uniref:UPAR/Ly6 domain-containing protein n=1 Tax=Mytilus galloprovincialis TaxID=29158 RepID=A0A8B6F514_MYTGA|nr:Hypothetical predicted protein [Mytilus galloprovincialis]